MIPVHLCKNCEKYVKDLEGLSLSVPNLSKFKGCKKAKIVEWHGAIIIKCPRFKKG